jgi:hypothetical protein
MISAIVNAQGVVVNRIVLDAASDWLAPDGCTAVEETTTVYEVGGSLIGGVYTPPVAPALAPLPAVTQVTPRQARLALYIYGLLDQVQAAVTAQGGTTLITWDYATYFDRNDPLITALGDALGLTASQIDDLFRFASTL